MLPTFNYFECQKSNDKTHLELLYDVSIHICKFSRSINVNQNKLVILATNIVREQVLKLDGLVDR